jgi:hypothetical protein
VLDGRRFYFEVELSDAWMNVKIQCEVCGGVFVSVDRRVFPEIAVESVIARLIGRHGAPHKSIYEPVSR